jgi:hypothetical protein
MANTVSNVSAGKPKVGGAVYRAPKGTALPTNASSELAAAYKALGYISEDGLVNSNAPESEDIKAWGGDTVLSVQTDKPDTFQMKFIESLNSEVLKTIYGDDNVSVESDGSITVKATSTEMEEAVYVVDMIMRGGALKRIVVPTGKISDLGDIEYKDDDAVGYDATITAMPDTNGVTHYEYIKPAA